MTFWKQLLVPIIFNRDRKVASNKAGAQRLAEDIRKRNLAKELVASRIKIECWDSMEVQKKEVIIPQELFEHIF